MKNKNIKKIIIIFLGIVVIGAGFYFAFRRTREAEAAWYANTWLYRKKITIDHTKVKGKLNNFPVLASTTDNLLSTYAQADGDDILFTSADGTTKLNHEIEKYVSADGQLVSWIQTDLSSTTDTILYMYYGNSSVGEQSTTTATWDSNFKGVWHLAHDGVATTTYPDFIDSTSNNNDGSSKNINSDSLVGGQIDGSLDFDGVDDYVNAGSDSSFDVTSLTISAWIYPHTVLSSKNGIMLAEHRYGPGGGSGPENYELSIQGSGGGTQKVLRNCFYNAGWVCNSGTTYTTANVWQYVSFTFDSSTKEYKFYIDGVDAGSGTAAKAMITNSTNNLYIGRSTDIDAGGSDYFDGLIDNVKIYDYVRTPAQIAWDYNHGAPVGHWKFDEGSGATTQDASENNKDGTIVGATWSTSGKIHYGLSFDGSGDEVAMGDVAISSASTYNEVSWGAWIKPSTSIASKAILVKNNEFRLVTDSSGNALCAIHNGTAWQVAATSTNALSLDKWHHIMCYYDKTNIKVYIDGQQDNSVALTQTVSNTANAFEVGDDAGGTYADYQGLVDDVRIYNYARPAAQILLDYNNAASARF